jgi:hypothetical protein
LTTGAGRELLGGTVEEEVVVLNVLVSGGTGDVAVTAGLLAADVTGRLEEEAGEEDGAVVVELLLIVRAKVAGVVVAVVEEEVAVVVTAGLVVTVGEIGAVVVATTGLVTATVLVVGGDDEVALLLLVVSCFGEEAAVTVDGVALILLIGAVETGATIVAGFEDTAGLRAAIALINSPAVEYCEPFLFNF